MELTIDGSKIRTLFDLHLVLKETLHFPDYYGMNLDALYDCLTDYLIDDTLIITWVDLTISRSHIGNTIDNTLSFFDMLSLENSRFSIHYLG